MTAQVWIAGIVGVAAIVDDLARRQISNWIPCSAFVAGVALQTFQNGWHGTASALLGTLTGAAVFLIFYLLGGMGGGDVKLMAGFGAVLGVSRLLEASLWTAGCGGLLALLVITYSSIRTFFKNRGAVQTGTPETIVSSRRVNSIPYAPAIAAGVWLSLVPKT